MTMLAIVGATGIMGRAVLDTLEAKGHPAEELTALASERSMSTEVDYGEESLEVEKAGPDSFRGVKAVILCAPSEVSKPLAESAQRAGAWVIDLSGAFRVDVGVPLVAPGWNDGVLDKPFTGRIVSIASGVTQALLKPLEALGRSHGLADVDCTVLLGASHSGSGGVKALEKQTASLLSGREEEMTIFPHRLAFNAIPFVGPAGGTSSAEELLVKVELARLLGQNAAQVGCTAIFVPFFHSALATVTVHTLKPVNAEGVKAALKDVAGLKWLDTPGEGIFPMPMLVAADAAIHIGRLRADGNKVQWVVAWDSPLHVAEGAVDVALELIERA